MIDFIDKISEFFDDSRISEFFNGSTVCPIAEDGFVMTTELPLNAADSDNSGRSETEDGSVDPTETRLNAGLSSPVV